MELDRCRRNASFALNRSSARVTCSADSIIHSLIFHHCIGRLDQHILVALPDHDARVQILRRLLRNTPLVFDHGTSDSDNPQHVQRSELCDWLAAESAGFSGAELSELCRNASLIGLRENLAIVGLERRHMAQALAQRRIKPS